MSFKTQLRKPFFEIGPKIYLYGPRVLELAKWADVLAARYDIDVMFTAQLTDIATIARSTSHIRVLAQCMDAARPGRGMGKVLPEALVYAGAQGVMLNHVENPMGLDELKTVIERADEVGLGVVLCAGNTAEARIMAELRPDCIVAEDPALIGGAERGDNDREVIQTINAVIYAVDPDIRVLHGAGIRDEKDVYKVILNGADGSGSTSGIMTAADPLDMTERMIRAVADAFKQRKEEE